jgi:hypothetical protein
LFTPRDDWFFALPENDTAKYSWRVGLEEIWKKYPDKWKKDPNDIGKGLIYMSSKHYDLGI